MSISFSKREPSPLEFLSRSLGQGIGGGLQARNALNLESEKMSIADRLKQAQQTKEQETKLTKVQEFFTTGAGKDFSPQEKAVGIGEAMGIIPPGTGTAILKQRNESEEQNKFLQAMGFGNAQTQDNGEMSEKTLPQQGIQPEQPPQAENKPKIHSFSENQLAQMQAKGGKWKSAADSEFKRREREAVEGYREQKLSSQEKQFAHKDTAEYAKGVRENADRGQEILHAVEDIEKRIKKTNVTGVNARNLAFNYFKGSKNPFLQSLANIFQTEDTQAIISATKTLAGGFRQLFGSKPTQAEFFWYENILPNILKDAATNSQAASYFGKVAKLSSQKTRNS